MTQYIDKSAVVAEIKRRLSLISQNTNAYEEGRKRTYIAVLYLLDSLETKEVNLEEDVDRILEEYDWNYDKIDFYEFARHFYELGLNTRKE